MLNARLALAVSLLFVGAAQAQGPAQTQAPAPATGQQPTQEQMQQTIMLRQMQMMAAMFDLKPSRLGFEETVAAIKASAEKRGWKVDPIQDIQSSMKAAGNKDAPRMKVIPTCPAGANDKLAKASQGKAPPLPCRITVFEAKDGTTQVMRFNSELIAKGMQGDAAKVMADVGAEELAMLKGIVQ